MQGAATVNGNPPGAVSVGGVSGTDLTVYGAGITHNIDAAATGAIVTAEEGLSRGGLGGAVAEFCAEHVPVPMRMLGFPGFAPTGSAAWLMEHFGLTAEGIEAAARALVEKRNA